MIKDSVIQVLTSDEAMLVNFSIFGVTVNGLGYRKLADKFSMGRATAVKSSHLPAGVAAHWRQSSDRLELRHHQPNFRIWQSTVIHEATHALVDLKRITISALNSDVLAYTAQLIFLRRSNYHFSSTSSIPHIRTPALALADSIIAGLGATPILVASLQSGIMSDPHYGSSYGTVMTNSNGI